MRDLWLGPYLNLKLTFAIDPSVRCERSSGGSVVALLSTLLETRTVNKIVALCESDNYPLPRFRSLTQFAPSALKTSFYVDPESSFVTQVVDGQQTVFVGLPCQIQAVKRLCHKRGISPPLLIGLFCGGISSIAALKVFLKRVGIALREVRYLSFRGGGMYGHFILRTDDRTIHFNRVTDPMTREKWLHDAVFFGPFFPRHCVMCTDVTSEEADISFGDAWIPRVMKDNGSGTNICIIRTQRGVSMLDYAVERGMIRCDEVRYEEVINSQGSALIGRKLGLWNYPRLTVFPSRVIFDSEVRYFPAALSPSFDEIWRRQVLWKLAKNRYLQLLVPEFDLSLRFIVRQMNRALAVMRAVKRSIRKHT
jgi:coenzyme F420 hydrogenase subunit beta